MTDLNDTSDRAEHLLLGHPEGCITCMHCVAKVSYGDNRYKASAKEHQTRVVATCIRKVRKGARTRQIPCVTSEELEAIGGTKDAASIDGSAITMEQFRYLCEVWPACNHYEMLRRRKVVEYLRPSPFNPVAFKLFEE